MLSRAGSLSFAGEKAHCGQGARRLSSMLPELLLPCVACPFKGNKEDLIFHLKKAHNLAVPRLIEFQDPRPYLLALRHIYSSDKTRLDSLLRLRESDGAMAVNRASQEDQALRRYAFAYLRDHVLRQVIRERTDVQEALECPICGDTLCNVTYHQLAAHIIDHGFRMGDPEEMVFLPSFFDALRDLFSTFTCPCCQSSFDKLHEFRAHLLANGHMRTPATDDAFDCYFVVNYKDIGRSWRHQGEPDNDDDEDDDPTKEDSDDYVDVEIPAYLAEIWKDLYPEDQERLEGSVECPMCSYSGSLQGCVEHLQTRGLSVEVIISFCVGASKEATVSPELTIFGLLSLLRRAKSHAQCLACQRSFETREAFETHVSTTSCSGHALPPQSALVAELEGTRTGEPEDSPCECGGFASSQMTRGRTGRGVDMAKQGDTLLRYLIDNLPDDSSDSSSDSCSLHEPRIPRTSRGPCGENGQDR